MKGSLNAKRVGPLLSQAFSFKTNHFSFRYLESSVPGIAFSINRGLGAAVLRNSIKRKSRALFGGPLFQGVSLEVIVRPLASLKECKNIAHDFQLFKKHLDSHLDYKKQ